MIRSAMFPIPVGCLILLALCGQPACSNKPNPPAQIISLDDFATPAPSFGPWVRWWWPGADVDATELRREIDLLVEAGFAGAEIQPFDAALDPNAPQPELDQRLAFDTPDYYAHLHTALDQAATRGLAIDLTFGSGWPAGGSRIAPADSLQTLAWGEWTIAGPGRVEIPKLAPTPSHFYLVAEFVAASFGEDLTRYLPDLAELVSLWAYPSNGLGRSASMLDLKDAVALDVDGAVDLTDLVAADGSFAWDAPDGTYQLVAIFAMPSGEYPQLVAEPGPGFVLDHLDPQAVATHLDALFEAGTDLTARAGAPLRAVFTDSFELKVDRFYAAGFLDEFEKRRGYDLRPWLPAVFLPGADNYIFEAGRLDREPEFTLGRADGRIRHDYTRTFSELFIERYLETKADWLGQRGLMARVQAYGIDVDPIRAAGAVQIPEAEQLYAGGSRLFLKAISAGAHLYGREIASAESMVFPLRDYMTTPAKIRAAADKAFAAGINQLVFHGFPYTYPGDYGLTGWTAFSSPYGGTNTFASNFGEQGPLFALLPPLTRYIRRCQFLLRQGRAEADLAVLYPFYGFPTSLALEPGYAEPLLGGFLPGEPELREVPFAELAALFGDPVPDRRAAWLIAIRPMLDDLETRGYTWEWINPHSLEAAKVSDGRISMGGQVFRALIVPEVGELDPAPAEQLASLARRAPVLLLGQVPDRQPGFNDYQAGDARVQAAVDKAIRATRGARSETLLEAAELLADLDVAPALALDGARELRMIHRRLANGGLVSLLANPSPAAEDFSLRSTDACSDPRWLDAWRGTAHATLADPAQGLAVTLPAHTARFLVCGDGPLAADRLLPPPDALRPGPQAASLALADWTLRVTGEDVPGGAFEQAGFLLADWRDQPELMHSASPGTYTTQLDLAALPVGGRAELDLGQVAGWAQVRINGGATVDLLVPPFRLDVADALSVGSNTVEVIVHPVWRNRLVGLGASGDERYAQFAGKEDTLAAAGLLGPVVLRSE